MHISEGVLSAPVLVAGAALTVAGTTIGLKKLDYDHIAGTGILSAAFFVASLIHIPIGPSSVHLILNGLLGMILGWGAFPAILVALLLQAVFFQFGGITTLGVNTLVMALPAVICWALFGRLIHRKPSLMMAGAFAGGFLSVLLAGLLAALALICTGENFTEVAIAILSAHIPVMFIEGIITAFTISFIIKVRPEMLKTG